MIIYSLLEAYYTLYNCLFVSSARKCNSLTDLSSSQVNNKTSIETRGKTTRCKGIMTISMWKLNFLIFCICWKTLLKDNDQGVLVGKFDK